MNGRSRVRRPGGRRVCALGGALVAFVVGATLAAARPPDVAPGIRRVAVTSNPVRAEHQVFNLRFSPTETRTFDTIRFDCFYRQEFTQRTSRGERRRVLESEAFTHRERNVRFVTDLDREISFRVPLGSEEIRRMFGSAYRADVPVLVSRIRVTAKDGEREVWRIEVPAGGVHEPPFESR